MLQTDTSNRFVLALLAALGAALAIVGWYRSWRVKPKAGASCDSPAFGLRREANPAFGSDKSDSRQNNGCSLARKPLISAIGVGTGHASIVRHAASRRFGFRYRLGSSVGSFLPRTVPRSPRSSP